MKGKGSDFTFCVRDAACSRESEGRLGCRMSPSSLSRREPSRPQHPGGPPAPGRRDEALCFAAAQSR